jgi:hypothetical protein
MCFTRTVTVPVQKPRWLLLLQLLRPSPHLEYAGPDIVGGVREWGFGTEADETSTRTVPMALLLGWTCLLP